MSLVLVVDDQVDGRYYLSALLAAHGHEVLEAGNGEEALALARDHAVDVVVSDLLMPVMDGYALLRQWRVDQTLRDVPFVVYTATYTDPEDQRLATELGADAFILKPAEPDEIMSRIATVLAQPTSTGTIYDVAVTSDEPKVLQRYNAALIRKLEDKMMQLEATSTRLRRNLAEREWAAEALRRTLDAEQKANEQLRDVEQLRMSFLSAVSHELRTPLTVIVGVAETLKHHRAALAADRQAELTDRLDVNARRLTRLLEDLLDLNQLAAGRAAGTPTRQRLREIVDEAVAETDLGDHPLEVDVDDIVVELDRARIVRVVANLLRNAVVHTDDGTPIAVLGRRNGHACELRVRDHGAGIRTEDRERLFEPFEQGPSAPSHQPGTGIGLSLVRQFVELHHGSVHVEETPGGGATFVVTLPVRVSQQG